MRFSLLILLLWLSVAALGAGLELAPNAINLDKILVAPAADAWFGYDDLGRSIRDRLMVGASISLIVAVAVVSISLIVGVTLGLLSAYIGGVTDRFIVTLIDIVMAFPGLLLAIALAGILGPSLNNVIIALSLVSWVGYARLTRAQVLSLRQRQHVQAAVALGMGHGSILVRHVLPLATAPIIVEASFGIASVVIAEAGLSFLGLGVQPPMASWGNMIRDGAGYLLVAPHMVVIPGAALFLVVTAINILGDRLRDFLDVTGERR